MIDDIKQPIEDIKENFKSRLESPYWGFIFFSWLGFNWQNIARLMMSEKPVEERITEITSQNGFLVHYWLMPVIIGIALAIAAPYFQLLIGLAHSKAVEYKDSENNRLRKKQEMSVADLRNLQIDLYEETEQKRKLAKTKLEMIESRKATRLAFQELRTKKFDGEKEKLEKELDDLKAKIAYASEQKRITDKTYETTLHNQDRMAQRLNDITKLYFKFDQLSSHEAFAEFMSALSKTDVLKLDHLDDNFKKMMEKEILLRSINNG